MKKYYKFLIILLVASFIVPQIALASWWNPFSWSIWNNIFHKADTKTEILENRVKELENKLNEQPASTPPTTDAAKTPTAKVNTPTPLVTKAPTIKVNTPSNKIIEENFRGSLVALYAQKIAFLKQKISLQDISKYGNELFIQKKKDNISFYENWLNTHANLGYSQTLIGLTSEAIGFWKYEVTERTKYLEVKNERITVWSQLKQRLEKELSDIPPQKFISETEYNFRTNELKELVDESNFEKLYAKQDASWNNWLDTANATDAKYYDLMLAVATKERAVLDQELADIKAENEAIKNTIVPQTPIVITPIQTKPTSISCETTHDVRSGYPSTTCIEFPSMKSMTCDTTYDTRSGAALKNCYFR